MAFTLSLNTNPLVNRFAEPDDLIDAIAYGIGIRDVQLTHEFVNPGWPAATIAKFVRQFKKALGRTGVRVTSGMTGPYGRLNHFGHPDADVRRYYVDWFKTFADITALATIDFAKSAKLTMPESAENLRRWHTAASARPSAAA